MSDFSQHAGPTHFRPGISVVLKDDPKGPVLTVTVNHYQDGVEVCKVVWLDVAGCRCESEYPVGDLRAVEV